MSETRYLVDVNVLLALSDPTHVHHSDAHRWLASLGEQDRWLSTPMTETALVRLLMNPVVMGATISAQSALMQLQAMKATTKHEFVADFSSLAEPEIELNTLFGYRQVTDFHLVNLAASVGAVFTTFDARIAKALSDNDKHHVAVIPSEL